MMKKITNLLAVLTVFIFFTFCSSSSINNDEKDTISEISDVLETGEYDVHISNETVDGEKTDFSDALPSETEIKSETDIAEDTDLIDTIDTKPYETDSTETNDTVVTPDQKDVNEDSFDVEETEDTTSDEVTYPDIENEVEETTDAEQDLQDTNVDPCKLCDDQGEDPVCGVKNLGDKVLYKIYKNSCFLECDDANYANCDEKPYSPVCDVETETTYDNACDAGCSGATSWVPGECSCQVLECSESDLEPHSFCGVIKNGNQYVCTVFNNKCEYLCSPDKDKIIDLYDGECAYDCEYPDECKGTFPNPLCALGQTWPNMCVFNYYHPNADVTCPGECISDYPQCTCNPDCDYLCGTDPETGKWKTYMNSCIMECVGGEYLFSDWCCDFENELQCDPTIDEPVCAMNLYTGEWENVKNACIVKCAIYLDEYKYYDGECVCCNGECCDLTDINYVCGEDGVTYRNECELNCAGVQKAYDGKCTCPDTYDPVCGADGNTYGNACVAKTLFGVTDFVPGECEKCKNLCDNNDYGPGCGTDGVSYPNWCVLWKCYTPDETVQCLTDDNCPEHLICKKENGEEYGKCIIGLVCEDNCGNCP